jgi:hypothetical protein
MSPPFRRVSESIALCSQPPPDRITRGPDLRPPAIVVSEPSGNVRPCPVESIRMPPGCEPVIGGRCDEGSDGRRTEAADHDATGDRRP